MELVGTFKNVLGLNLIMKRVLKDIWLLNRRSDDEDPYEPPDPHISKSLLCELGHTTENYTIQNSDYISLTIISL